MNRIAKNKVFVQAAITRTIIQGDAKRQPSSRFQKQAEMTSGKVRKNAEPADREDAANLRA